MATKTVNAKSQKLAARVPHEVAQAMEQARTEGESVGQFIVTALRAEIKRRRLRARRND